MKKLSFAESKEMMERDPDVRVADVREEQEFATGHVENAVNLPLTALIDVPPEEGEAFADAVLPGKDAPVLVYCRTGRRSVMAAEALVRFGYTRVLDMGGLEGWPYGLAYD